MPERVNWDYIKQLKDFYLFLKTRIRFALKKRLSEKKDKILVVDPCLVGDFMASLPALRQFIKDNRQSKIDLIVSPPLKELAKRIRGVRNVYVARSSTSRQIEKAENNTQKLHEYDEIVVMRISKEAYKMIKRVRTGKIHVPLKEYVKFQIVYMVRDAILKRRPVQRREIDFDILNQKLADVKFEEIFNFERKDYERIKKMKEINTKERIVIIHTGPVWIMRKWSNERWAELINKINNSGKFRFVFVGTGEAEKDFKEISGMLNFRVYSLINKVNLRDLMLVIRKSGYLIGVDSGPRNMAHLADVRSVTIFGPAASGAIYMPWSSKDIVVDKSNGGGAYESLFYKKRGFIHQINSDDVFEAFRKLRRIV